MALRCRASEVKVLLRCAWVTRSVVLCMNTLHSHRIVASLVLGLIVSLQASAQTMHRTGRLEGYRTIRDDGLRAARVVGLDVEIYDWQGDSVKGRVIGPRDDGQIDAMAFAGTTLYAVWSDGRETFELYALADNSKEWIREPISIDSLWHPQDETRDVWCEYLAEAKCLVIQVRTAFSPDWGKTTVTRCIVDLATHTVRPGSRDGFPSVSRSPDGSYYHFGSSYLSSRSPGADKELFVEVQTVEAATLKVISTDTMHPSWYDNWYTCSPVSLGCRQVVAHGPYISRPHANAHVQTGIDRSTALVCIARPSTIVYADYNTEVHLRKYGDTISDTMIDDAIVGSQSATRATYDRVSGTVLVYYMDQICSSCWPIVSRYHVEGAVDEPDRVMTLQSAGSAKVLDSIGVRILPFTNAEPQQLHAVSADSIYDCTRGSFVIHGTSVGTTTYSIVTSIDGKSAAWHNETMSARFYMPSAFQRYASVSGSIITDIALAPNGRLIGVGSIRSAQLLALTDRSTTSLGAVRWSTTSPGALCFATYEGGMHAILASYESAGQSGTSEPELNVAELNLSSMHVRSLCSTTTHEFPRNDLLWLSHVPIPRFDETTGTLTVREAGYRIYTGTPTWQNRGCLHRWSCSIGPLRVVQDRPLKPTTNGNLLFVADMADTLITVRTDTTNHILNSSTGEHYQTMPDSVLGSSGRSRMPDPYRLVTPTQYWSWDGKWVRLHSFSPLTGYYVIDLDSEYVCVLRSDTNAIGFIVSLATGETVEVFGEGGCIPVCGRYDPYQGVIYIGDRCGNIGVVVPTTMLQRRTPEVQDTAIGTSSPHGAIAEADAIMPMMVRRGDDLRVTCRMHALSVSVYNSAGASCQEQKTQSGDSTECQIPTTGLVPGMYVAVVRASDGSVRRLPFAVE